MEKLVLITVVGLETISRPFLRSCLLVPYCKMNTVTENYWLIYVAATAI